MTKADLIEALKPFTDDLVIDVAIGAQCLGTVKIMYELVDGVGHAVLCGDRDSVAWTVHRMERSKKV